MNPSIPTHASGGGKGLAHAIPLLAGVLLFPLAVVVFLYVGFALLFAGTLGQVVGTVVLALSGLAAAVYFRWALK